jgi:hypothetical protein
MDLNFLMEIETMPAWRILKMEILGNSFPLYREEMDELGSHDLVHVLVDGKGNPKTYKSSEEDVESFCVFTRPELLKRMGKTFTRDEIQGGVSDLSGLNNPEGLQLKMMMLGELSQTISHRGKETAIKINPLLLSMAKGMEPLLFAEEVLFAPQRDKFTGKLLLTDPEDAKALLAVNPEDQKRFGIELVFYMLTTRDLPEDREEKEAILKERIEELSFKAPRVPMMKGSGTFLAVLLNLENELEEQAFIRDYPMFDQYSDIIFVTSSLKMMTGRLEEVHYNGAKIDTIFAPMIEWQKNKNRRRNHRLSQF